MRSLLGLSAVTTTMLLLLLSGTSVEVQGKKGSAYNYGITSGDVHKRAKESIVEQHSLHPPYISDFWSDGVPYWNFFGSTVITDHFVRLTPDATGKTGTIWNEQPLEKAGWEITMGFRVSSRSPIGADGFALWLVDQMPEEKSGPLYGHPAKFTGLGIIFDSYDNDFKKDNPAIHVLYNPDGETSFNGEGDFNGQSAAKCEYDFRNSLKPDIIIARIVYQEDELSLYLSHSNSGAAEFRCLTAKNINLKQNHFYLGLTADTGGVSDNHDIYFLHTVPVLSDWQQGHRDYDHDHEHPEHDHRRDGTDKHYWRAKTPEELAAEETEKHKAEDARLAELRAHAERNAETPEMDRYRHQLKAQTDFAFDDDDDEDAQPAAPKEEQKEEHPWHKEEAEGLHERNKFNALPEDHPVHHFDDPKPGTKEWNDLSHHEQEARFQDARARHEASKIEKDRQEKEEAEAARIEEDRKNAEREQKLKEEEAKRLQEQREKQEAEEAARQQEELARRAEEERRQQQQRHQEEEERRRREAEDAARQQAQQQQQYQQQQQGGAQGHYQQQQQPPQQQGGYPPQQQPGGNYQQQVPQQQGSYPPQQGYQQQQQPPYGGQQPQYNQYPPQQQGGYPPQQQQQYQQQQPPQGNGGQYQQGGYPPQQQQGGYPPQQQQQQYQQQPPNGGGQQQGGYPPQQQQQGGGYQQQQYRH